MVNLDELFSFYAYRMRGGEYIKASKLTVIDAENIEEIVPSLRPGFYSIRLKSLNDEEISYTIDKETALQYGLGNLGD